MPSPGEEIVSSEAEAEDTTAQDVNEATAAESSAAADQDAENPSTMLDALSAAVKGEEPSTSEDSQEEDAEAPEADVSQTDEPAEGGASEAEKEEAEELSDPTDAELRGYKPKTRKRIEQLLAQRDSAAQEVEQYRASHEAFQRVTSFIQEAKLSTEEVNTGFEIMRLMKSDPVKALEALAPLVASLQQHTGDRLPADLQQQVDTGHLAEQHARELARLRAEHARTQAMTQEQAQQLEEQQRRQVQQAHIDEMSRAISDWEFGWRKSDPDYQRLQPRVQEKLELAIRRDGYPRDKDAAVKLAERARSEVKQELAQLMPGARQEIRPVTGGASAPSKPEPQNMLQAMQQALG